MYYNLGQRFLSPTVNLLFSPHDFIIFLKNIYQYLEKNIIFIETKEKYPIGKLGELTIKFLHYESEESALNSWNERKKRINEDNLFIICCDEGLKQEEILEFDNLPYKNKILFVHEKIEGIKSAIEAKEFKNKTDARLLNFANFLGKRFYQNYIDYIEWLNIKKTIRRIINEK